MIELAVPGVVRDQLSDAGYGRNICILATATVIDVCGYFGIEAWPVECGAQAFNGEALQLIADNVPVGDWPENAWSVGTQPNRDLPTGGHLVALTESGHLIDAATGQFVRPFKRLNFEPHATPIDLETFTRGAAVIVRGVPSTSVLTYRFTPNAGRTWRRAPDWNKKQKRRRAVGAAIRQLKEREQS